MLPPKFRTVKQPPDSRLCVAAVAAMAVGRGLRYAINRMPNRRWRDGKQYHKTRDWLALLGSHGIHCGLVCVVTGTGPIERLKADAPMAGGAAICAVPSENFPGYEHLIFWDGKVVRDPDPAKPDTGKLADYRLLEIVPLIYVDERAAAVAAVHKKKEAKTDA